MPYMNDWQLKKDVTLVACKFTHQPNKQAAFTKPSHTAFPSTKQPYARLHEFVELSYSALLTRRANVQLFRNPMRSSIKAIKKIFDFFSNAKVSAEFSTA